MLGEQIAEARGKITGQRVLDVEGPKIEYSFAASGTMKGYTNCPYCYVLHYS